MSILTGGLSMLKTFQNSVNIYFKIRFYHFLMNYKKIEYNARKVWTTLM